MRIIPALALLLIVTISMTGCIYTNIKTPYDTDLDKTQLGTQTGEASFQSWFWLVAWGDAGTAAAAKDGNVTTLTQMDKQIISILFGLYYQETTIVYGD